jgi:hypothetical protein
MSSKEDTTYRAGLTHDPHVLLSSPNNDGNHDIAPVPAFFPGGSPYQRANHYHNNIPPLLYVHCPRWRDCSVKTNSTCLELSAMHGNVVIYFVHPHEMQTILARYPNRFTLQLHLVGIRDLRTLRKPGEPERTEIEYSLKVGTIVRQVQTVSPVEFIIRNIARCRTQGFPSYNVFKFFFWSVSLLLDGDVVGTFDGDCVFTVSANGRDTHYLTPFHA